MPPAPAGGMSARAAEVARPLRILMVVESSGGGTGRHVLDLCDGLLQRGHQVHLIYSTGRIDKLFTARLAEIQGLSSHPLSMHTSVHAADLGATHRIRRYMREHGPFDIVHGHSSKGGALTRLAVLGTPAAAIYTLHGLIMMDPTLNRVKRLFYLSIEMLLSLRTARIIAVSPEEARAAVKLRFGHARVVLVPNGVGLPRLTPRADARRDIGVPEDAHVIGFVGRLVEQKAPHVLIESFAATARVAPNARLAIVGDGPLREPMRQLSARLGVEDKVLFLGERDAREVMAAFDVFALSSRKEGLPYVLLEAMAAGLPLVATATSSVEILIQPGRNGEIVPMDDIAGFTRALIALATDPARMNAYGNASLELAATFTIDAMVERTLAAYAEVAHGARSRPSVRILKAGMR